MTSVFNNSFFLFTVSAHTEIYTLSLHDALPISFSSPVRATPPVRFSLPRVAVIADNGRPGATPSSPAQDRDADRPVDRKSTRLNSSHVEISYAVFCLKKKKKQH